jgi:hypothetical protein
MEGVPVTAAAAAITRSVGDKPLGLSRCPGRKARDKIVCPLT